MAHPRVGLGVFIFRSRNSNEIAWGLRKNSLGHGMSTLLRSRCQTSDLVLGTWSLAGGHLEFNETFEQCAIRETREETGLEIEDVRFLTAMETFLEYQGRQHHYVTIFMMGFARKGDSGEEEAELMVSLVSVSLVD
jgi:8-oxo-dGTP diphosphatase